MVVNVRQTRNVRGHAGEPLPSVWKGLDEIGVRFRRGQLVLVAAAPGTGKSTLVLSYILQAGVRAMYFSADSDASDQIGRATAVLTGVPFNQARDEFVQGKIRPEVEAAPIYWSFDAQPTLKDIDDELEALYEGFLFEPEVIVIDNATNVLSGFAGNDEDPFGGLEALMDHLSALARRTGACVFATHHVKAEFNDANKPIPLSGVKGQITRVPPMVLTLSKQPAAGSFGPEILRVSSVKNRGAKMDPSGSLFAEIEFDGDRTQLRDLT